MKTKKFMTLLIVFGVMITSVFAINKTEIEKLPNFELEIIESGTIVEVAVSNENFTTLVAAVKAANLVETLNSEGPFTVFAPVNSAFEKLPSGTVENLLKPENIKTLQAVLTYHVVAGEFKAATVVEAIQKNNGSFVIKTVQGENLTATLNDNKVILTDAKGNKSTVIIADVPASNGIIHAIDTVLLP